MPLILVQRSLAIVGLGCIVGAADSWLRPTVITLRENAPARTAIAATPGPASAAGEAAVENGRPLRQGAVTDPIVASGDKSENRARDLPVGEPASLGLMITAKAAKSLFDQGDVVFLDARIQKEYDQGRIPQAYLLNASLFGTAAGDEAMKAMDAEQPVVIYCGGGDCDASKNVAILLQQAGFKQVHIIEQGFPEWVQMGYPVETSVPKTGGGQ